MICPYFVLFTLTQISARRAVQDTCRQYHVFDIRERSRFNLAATFAENGQMNGEASFLEPSHATLVC